MYFMFNLEMRVIPYLLKFTSNYYCVHLRRYLLQPLLWFKGASSSALGKST